MRRTELLPEKAIQLVTWACLLLQEGCRAGLTPYDIATLIVRQNEVPSDFERFLADREDPAAHMIAAAKTDMISMHVLNEKKEDLLLNGVLSTRSSNQRPNLNPLCPCPW